MPNTDTHIEREKRRNESTKEIQLNIKSIELKSLFNVMNRVDFPPSSLLFKTICLQIISKHLHL